MFVTNETAQSQAVHARERLGGAPTDIVAVDSYTEWTLGSV